MSKISNIKFYIVRPFLKHYVRYLVKEYLKFCESHQGRRSNTFIAKARLKKAKLMYWQNMFEAWGPYFYFGPHEFSYNGEDKHLYEDEMVWMGFTRELRKKEYELCQNEAYPWTIHYYPSKQTPYIKNVCYPLDYRETINKETNTYENYEIPQPWKGKQKQKQHES